MGRLVVRGQDTAFWLERVCFYLPYFRRGRRGCSTHIDDRLFGEALRSEGPWSTPYHKRPKELSLKAAQSAVLVACYILISLGYFLGLAKCLLTPTSRLEFLGFIIDSELQEFKLPERKIRKFAELRDSILRSRKKVALKTLQKFQGKCVSFSLAIPAAKLYIRSVANAISVAHGKREVQLSKPLRDEIAHWRFLDSWTDHVPWRKELHAVVSMSTDASGSGWGGIFHLQDRDAKVRDYWGLQEKLLAISTKETLAVAIGCCNPLRHIFRTADLISRRTAKS